MHHACGRQLRAGSFGGPAGCEGPQGSALLWSPGHPQGSAPGSGGRAVFSGRCPWPAESGGPVRGLKFKAFSRPPFPGLERWGCPVTVKGRGKSQTRLRARPEAEDTQACHSPTSLWVTLVTPQPASGWALRSHSRDARIEMTHRETSDMDAGDRTGCGPGPSLGTDVPTRGRVGVRGGVSGVRVPPMEATSLERWLTGTFLGSIQSLLNTHVRAGTGDRGPALFCAPRAVAAGCRGPDLTVVHQLTGAPAQALPPLPQRCSLPLNVSDADGSPTSCRPELGLQHPQPTPG